MMLVLAAGAAAHPGVGIVEDSRGNVYFTDLKQVWRRSPDGKTVVVVPGVHTHELHMDAQDNLYGEHLWYEGERIDKWGHRVWRLSADGKLEDVIPAREGFLQNYSFVRDAASNMYWADRAGTGSIRKRLPDGRVVTVASGGFHDIRWMTAHAGGTIYLIDQGKLKRVAPDGRVDTLTAELRQGWFDRTNQHALMGLAVDSAHNVYIANFTDRRVYKVTPAGEVTVAAQSRLPWSPVGVLISRRGELLVLEGAAAAARVTTGRTSRGGGPGRP